MMKITSNMEDYLEAIAIVAAGEEGARVKDIGNLLSVKNPSVTGALNTLSKMGLVVHEKYGRVKLTLKGAQIAAEVKGKHSLISRFLHEVVGIPKKIAEIDACKIEHILSKETYEKLKSFFEKRISEKQKQQEGK